MTAPADRNLDQSLLDAILGFVAAHPDRNLAAFREPLANWGHDWSGVPPRHLAASDLLEQALSRAKPGSKEVDLLSLFVRERFSRHWEQSYTLEDLPDGNNMLDNYGFCEVVGKHGPFLSDRVRAGVGVFGPEVDYPSHRHKADEVYAILSGSGWFRLGDDQPQLQTAGNLIHIPSQLPHGIRVADEPLAILYLWRSGDLREKSTFV